MTISIASLSSSSSVSNLFAKIDTKNQGYIEKGELQTALDQLSLEDNSTTVDKIFSKLDTDNDGQLTEQEMVDGMEKLAAELNGQYNQSRLGQGGSDDSGFSQDELTSMIEEIGDSDSERTSLMQSIVDNFDTADTDGDGTVSNSEAIAYDQSANGTASAASAAGMPPPPPSGGESSDTTYDAADTNEDGSVSLEELMAYYGGDESGTSSDSSAIMKIMSELMTSYGLTDTATVGSSVSVTA